jgi:hypothetical protein
MQLDEYTAYYSTVRFASNEELNTVIGHSYISLVGRTYSDTDSIPVKPTSFHCESCAMGKTTHQRPQPQQVKQTTKAFKSNHSDLSGKFLWESI